MKRYVAEALGTGILVFAGCGAIVTTAVTGEPGHVGIALTFGMVVSAMIYTFGHISGAHINPAVTLAFYRSKELNGKETVGYILAQLLGATIGAWLLRILFIPENKQAEALAYYGATLPHGPLWQSFVFETILSFILMLVIYGSAVHGKAIKSFAGIAIGFTVGVEALFAGPITGASMNPARSIAPALVSMHLDALWIYIVAPMLGMQLATWVYTKLWHHSS